MKVIQVQAEDELSAQAKLARNLGVALEDLRYIGRDPSKNFSFEVISCPASIDVEISRDGMKAFWKKLRLPIGKNAPPLTTETVVELLKEKGVTTGVKFDIISKELFRISQTPGFDESKPLDILIAEGWEPIAAQSGRPQMAIDLKLFEKKVPVFVRKGEVLARAPHAAKGQNGCKVTGEEIAAPVEEQFRLAVSQNIEVLRTDKEVLYVAKTFGRVYFDEGIRLRIDAKAIDVDDGLGAALETGPKSFTQASITAADLIEAAQELGVSFGFLPEAEIEKQMKAVKTWPAQILVARGQAPVDGKPGEVSFPFKTSMSDKAIDQLKAKNKIVFPQEILAIIRPPSEPVHGKTVYGEVLRGRPYNEIPIYPGKNVTKERAGDDQILRSTVYGRVSIDSDRVNVNNLVNVSKDAMTVTLDLFPQKKLTFQDVANLLREKDVLFGFDKDSLERELERVHAQGGRVPEFVLARGRPIRSGRDASLVFHFDEEHFKKKGMFQKNATGVIFAAPKDLLLEKILPVAAEDGMNVYRERIPVPPSKEAKDIKIKVGENIDEEDLGVEGDEQNPLRIAYRSRTLGEVVWKANTLDVKASIRVDKEEKEFQLGLAPTSDFKTRVTPEMIEAIAREEGVKVDLELAAIHKALREVRPADKSLRWVTIAKAIEPQHGSDAQIEYLIEFNGKKIDDILRDKRKDDEILEFCDCVRPGDVLAKKTPAGRGVDGKTVFGRRLPAHSGLDEPWLMGMGVDKSPDGLELVVSSPSPGFVTIENGRICVRNTAKVSPDKMTVKMAIYPTKNPRFVVREDRILGMIAALGVREGLRKDLIREALETCLREQRPVVDVIVAEGRAPVKGKSASFHFQIDTGDTVGELRKDGSIDYKNRGIFQSVKKGQLLLIKRPAVKGQDGFDVFGNLVPGLYGDDLRMDAGVGVEVSDNDLEYRSAIDGIVEIQQRSIRVIPGLLINGDVDLKTGNIEAGGAQVFIKGSVLPGFSVHSEKDVNIEKVAEACTIYSKEAIRARGGIIGKNQGLISAGGIVEAFYITSGATVEAQQDVIVGSEIMNSTIRTGGIIHCLSGAGTVCGGEIWTYGGLKVKVLGAMGSETQTVVHLGANYFGMRAAEKRIQDEGIDGMIATYDAQLSDLNQRLREIYAQIPETMKVDVEKGQKLQNEYRGMFNMRQELVTKVERLKKQKEAILSEVPWNKDAVVMVTDMIHPGVTIIYKDVTWVLKEPLKGVEIRWNVATSNLVSRRV